MLNIRGQVEKKYWKQTEIFYSDLIKKYNLQSI
jgi:hypothetical protein